MAFDLKMEVYTPTLELVGMLNEWKSVIWEEKAFTAGSFSLDSIISAETRELLVKENIIWIEGESAGIIEHIEQKADDTGPYITVEGRMLTGILDRRILWGMYNLSGTPAAIMHRLVDDCAINPTRGNVEARKIHGLVSRETPTGGASIQVQMTGDTLLERLETLGRTYGVAFGVAFNAAVPRMEFWTRYGVDRSVNQKDNDPVFYSTELDDVLASEYTYDSSRYRNVALVAGEGEGDERKMIVVEENMPAAPLPPTPPGPDEPDEPVTKYAITATVDPSGSGKVTGAGQYEENATVNLTATANDGYNFTDWKEDGETIHNEPEYSFTAERNRDLVAAFAEIPSGRLPAGYTEVEYIQSDGTQYIDTGRKPTSTTVIKLDVEILDSKNSTLLNSSYSPASGTSYYLSLNNTAGSIKIFTGSLQKGGTANYLTLSSNAVGKRTNITIDYPGKKASIEYGSTVTLSNVSTSENMSTINLLASTGGASVPSAKLYSFFIDDSEGKMELIPCTNPDGKAGLYDLAGKKFYSNAGSGSFAAGPAV